MKRVATLRMMRENPYFVPRPRKIVEHHSNYWHANNHSHHAGAGGPGGPGPGPGMGGATMGGGGGAGGQGAYNSNVDEHVLNAIKFQSSTDDGSLVMMGATPVGGMTIGGLTSNEQLEALAEEDYHNQENMVNRNDTIVPGNHNETLDEMSMLDEHIGDIDDGGISMLGLDDDYLLGESGGGSSSKDVNKRSQKTSNVMAGKTSTGMMMNNGIGTVGADEFQGQLEGLTEEERKSLATRETKNAAGISSQAVAAAAAAERKKGSWLSSRTVVSLSQPMDSWKASILQPDRSSQQSQQDRVSERRSLPDASESKRLFTAFENASSSSGVVTPANFSARTGSPSHSARLAGKMMSIGEGGDEKDEVGARGEEQAAGDSEVGASEVGAAEAASVRSNEVGKTASIVRQDRDSMPTTEVRASEVRASAANEAALVSAEGPDSEIRKSEKSEAVSRSSQSRKSSVSNVNAGGEPNAGEEAVEEQASDLEIGEEKKDSKQFVQNRPDSEDVLTENRETPMDKTPLDSKDVPPPPPPEEGFDDLNADIPPPPPEDGFQDDVGPEAKEGEEDYPPDASHLPPNVSHIQHQEEHEDPNDAQRWTQGVDWPDGPEDWGATADILLSQMAPWDESQNHNESNYNVSTYSADDGNNPDDINPESNNYNENEEIWNEEENEQQGEYTAAEWADWLAQQHHEQTGGGDVVGTYHSHYQNNTQEGSHNRGVNVPSSNPTKTSEKTVSFDKVTADRSKPDLEQPFDKQFVVDKTDFLDNVFAGQSSSSGSKSTVQTSKSTHNIASSKSSKTSTLHTDPAIDFFCPPERDSEFEHSPDRLATVTVPEFSRRKKDGNRNRETDSKKDENRTRESDKNRKDTNHNSSRSAATRALLKQKESIDKRFAELKGNYVSQSNSASFSSRRENGNVVSVSSTSRRENHNVASASSSSSTAFSHVNPKNLRSKEKKEHGKKERNIRVNRFFVEYDESVDFPLDDSEDEKEEVVKRGGKTQKHASSSARDSETAKNDSGFKSSGKYDKQQHSSNQQSAVQKKHSDRQSVVQKSLQKAYQKSFDSSLSRGSVSLEEQNTKHEDTNSKRIKASKPLDEASRKTQLTEIKSRLQTAIQRKEDMLTQVEGQLQGANIDTPDKKKGQQRLSEIRKNFAGSGR